jgi:hypothetical protein
MSTLVYWADCRLRCISPADGGLRRLTIPAGTGRGAERALQSQTKSGGFFPRPGISDMKLKSILVFVVMTAVAVALIWRIPQVKRIVVGE